MIPYWNEIFTTWNSHCLPTIFDCWWISNNLFYNCRVNLIFLAFKKCEMLGVICKNSCNKSCNIFINPNLLKISPSKIYKITKAYGHIFVKRPNKPGQCHITSSDLLLSISQKWRSLTLIGLLSWVRNRQLFSLRRAVAWNSE